MAEGGEEVIPNLHAVINRDGASGGRGYHMRDKRRRGHVPMFVDDGVIRIPLHGKVGNRYLNVQIIRLERIGWGDSTVRVHTRDARDGGDGEGLRGRKRGNGMGLSDGGGGGSLHPRAGKTPSSKMMLWVDAILLVSGK